MAAQNKAEVKDHHIKSSLCPSRPKYREAKWARAVKVIYRNLNFLCKISILAKYFKNLSFLLLSIVN